MSVASEPPQQAFKPSMLFNDTRYRGFTFQFIALMALIAFFYWLASNAVANLAALGQDISFEFLGQPAGYDINQQLIPFVSTDTHMRAAIVGVMNTLLVAFFGCILATIIGVVVGVLRLSGNWLVAKLMSVYVEVFRNVPVLIWILIIFSVMQQALPQPRAFRGDDATASMVFDAFAFTNRGVYIPRPIWLDGAGIVGIVLLLSILGIFWFRRYARHQLYEYGRDLPTGWVSLGLFFVPALVAFFALGRPIEMEYPELRGFNFQGGIQIFGSFIGLWLALSLYTGAFIAENVRAGILAVSKGQTEAAASLGLRPNRIMSLVVLPQALRVIIPPLISQYLNLTKNSSLAAAVATWTSRARLAGSRSTRRGEVSRRCCC